jgi:hypothetical protein
MNPEKDITTGRPSFPMVLTRIYLATAYGFWMFACYYIAGDAGLGFNFSVSIWGRLGMAVS